ncbi:phage late control D family protein [Paenibacillus psychroresistens]|uniref:Phage late control D family protein n=1 Tax=Paenibacillus psychroresistens TaxID=1778678 RepID=A0A6B8RNC9_9BACL|nr:phage late control D family protein [Paenibacillus psychroresistens]QGQ97055.1 phage late control D family protein [Paenibacillus psychroresistens]
MNIIYNGADITGSVQPTKLQLTDNSGGKPDSLEISFSDSDGVWSKWKPVKNDTIQILESGFDSGIMFVDQLSQSAGMFGIMALSIPQASKTARTQGWEKVRLLEIVTEIATRYGLSLQTYNIANHLYERIDQQEIADFVFLADLCLAEGYALKINNLSLVIYDEYAQEQIAADPKLSLFGEGNINDSFEFLNESTEIYQKCIVCSNGTEYIEGSYSATDILGPTLKRSVYATNQAEANRWAKGLLRSYNKHMITGSLSINLNTNYAAGTNISVEDIGLFDGKYAIHSLTHDLINNKTSLSLRKPLEGY